MNTKDNCGSPASVTKVFEKILLFVVVAAIASFLVNEVYDLDVWWHIPIGNDILNRLSLPLQDRFAAASLERPYHDSHWLFQIMLALADRAAGMAGVELLMISIWGLTLFFCHRAASRWGSPVVAHLLLFIAAMAATERFLPRPEIITFLMIAFLFQRLQERRYVTFVDLALLGTAQAIWTNCHGLFVIGPFMAGCYWFVAAIDHLRGRNNDFRRLTRLLAVLLAATLATPYGFGGWRYALLLFTETGAAAPLALKGVGELSPTFGAAARSGYAFWFFAVLLAGVVLTTIIRLVRRQVSLERLLIVIGLAAAAMTGRRNIVLFALVAAPFTAEQLQTLMPERKRLVAPLCAVFSLALLAWAWFPLSGAYYLKMEIPSRFGLGATSAFFPHNLSRFLDRTGFQGQVFNSNSLGGFYLYHGYPQRIPLTDGRWETYDQQTLNMINESSGNPLLWAKILEKYAIRGVLLQHTSPEAVRLLPLLSKDNAWRLVYLDHAASFWMRNDTPRIPDRIDLSAHGTLPSNPSSIHDCLILDNFLAKVEARELRIANLRRALSFGMATETLLEPLGQELLRAGRLQDAELTFERLQRLDPENKSALSELAFAAYNRGELTKAESLLRRALKSAPDDPDIKANYQRVREAVEKKSVR